MGALIDKDLISPCVVIYEQMGMGSLDTYVTDFETQLLDASR